MTRTCVHDGCGQPAAAWVGMPVLPGQHFAIVYPVGCRAPAGVALCVDHVHTAIDVMLMGSRPEPTA